MLRQVGSAANNNADWNIFSFSSKVLLQYDRVSRDEQPRASVSRVGQPLSRSQSCVACAREPNCSDAPNSYTPLIDWKMCATPLTIGPVQMTAFNIEEENQRTLCFAGEWLSGPTSDLLERKSVKEPRAVWWCLHVPDDLNSWWLQFGVLYVKRPPAPG